MTTRGRFPQSAEIYIESAILCGVLFVMFGAIEITLFGRTETRIMLRLHTYTFTFNVRIAFKNLNTT